MSRFHLKLGIILVLLSLILPNMVKAQSRCATTCESKIINFFQNE